MISLTKALVALAAVGLFSVIGVREFSAACGPAKPAADAHGHGGGGEAAHAQEGFGAKVCEDGLLTAFKEKHRAIDIPDSIFEAVHDGMEGVVSRGTGQGSKVKDIAICGKTGTVENYFRGVKQPNHGFFCGFAPRDNPKIAIMCVVENSGRFGGTYAAPIVGFMIEKYLKDSITDKARKERLEYYSNLNLIPPRIYAQIRTQDSMRHSKDSAYLVAKGYIKLIKDTLEIDEEDEQDALDKLKKDKETTKKTPGKDSTERKMIIKPDAILPNEKKRQEARDTAGREQ